MGCIHLIQMGTVPSPLSQNIAQNIETGLGVTVCQHPPLTIPDYVYDPSRGQYHATRLLEYLESHPVPPTHHVIGLTHVDLFIPILTYVFGEARLNAPHAVLSLCRLMPQFYGLPQDDTITVRRSAIESIHELGHTFGLRHCATYPCAMHASRTADDIDLKSLGFCQDCANHLQQHHLQPNRCT